MKIIRFLIAILILFSIVICVWYLPTNVYDFQKPSSFQGKNWYNPYQQSELEQYWFKGNFHIHGQSWGGITNGNQTDKNVYEAYDQLGFDIIGISNYQKTGSNLGVKSLVNCYEHGYGSGKHHQIILGSTEVSWLDFPFWQNKHQKQTVLSKINTDNNFVAIAHPSFLEAYSETDLQLLSSYDGIEIASNTRSNFEQWDQILNSGYPAVLICNDDCHNVADIKETGHYFTLINSNSTNEPNFINNLKLGKSIGIQLFTPIDTNITFEQRKEQISHLEEVPELLIENDTLKVSVKDSTISIKFITGIGKSVSFWNVLKAEYPLKKANNYVRVQVNYKKSNNLFYFNPVWKFKSDPFENKMTSTYKNRVKSIFLKSLLILIIVGLGFALFKLYSSKNSN